MAVFDTAASLDFVVREARLRGLVQARESATEADKNDTSVTLFIRHGKNLWHLFQKRKKSWLQVNWEIAISAVPPLADIWDQTMSWETKTNLLQALYLTV